MSIRMWCSVVASAAVLSFSSLASAGVVLGEFRVGAEGDWVEDGNNISIDALVTSQDPALGFESLDALFEVEEVGDPGSFTGSFSLIGGDGTLDMLVTGAFFSEGEDEFTFFGLAGVFEVVGGSGVFEGLSGAGIFTALGAGDESGDIVIELGGVLVPAPATLALLGVAGVVAPRRRRRA